MKTSKTNLVLALALMLIASGLRAQTIKEAVQPLSKKAHKGYVDDTSIDANGINVLYKISGDKNKDELFYESYTFDKDLKFLEVKAANEPKIESKPDRERTFMSAWVGGGTSFDILSMKLRVNIRKVNQSWDYKKQRYVSDKKPISDETVKLKNEGGKAYYGVDQYRSDETGDFIVLAYYETKDKKNPRQFVLLTITFEGEVTEKPLDINGAYSMVYCAEVSEDTPGKPVGKQDFVLVTAPMEGNGDPSNYVYLHYDIKGTLKNKVEFKSPSPHLLINSIDVKDGEVFFSGLSTKGTDPYGEVFKDYMPIENPYYSGGGANAQMDRYNKAASEEMDNVHFLKFSGNKLQFASTAPISEFKAKMKTAPSEKSGKLYKGKKFGVQSFEVTPANEYLLTGQLISMVNIGGLQNPDFRTAYGDIVCLHFDAKGNLKAQYAVDKVFEDKKSEIFSMPQRFYVSADGKYAYWEIMEVMGTTDYASWSDAYNGRKRFIARFFPRITRIDLEKATLSDFKYPGNKKFFVYRDGYYFNSNTSTRTFIGRDEDNENLWVSTVKFD